MEYYNNNETEGEPIHFANKKTTVQQDRFNQILGNLLDPQRPYLINTRENYFNYFTQ